MATDLKYLGIDDEESIEEIANAVQDDLTASLKEYPGQMTSPESIGRAAYDVVRTAFGVAEDD